MAPSTSIGTTKTIASKPKQSNRFHTWNGHFPEVAKNGLVPDELHMASKFESQALAWHLQNGTSSQHIEHYLKHCRVGARELGLKVYNIPLIFYMVATQDADLLELAIKLGGDVNATIRLHNDDQPVSLLVSAIINQARQRRPSPKLICTLLGYGAHVGCIPSWCWGTLTPVNGTEVDLEEQDELSEPAKKWYLCTQIRQSFTKGLDITTRYYLGKAARIVRGPRYAQIARYDNLKKLLRLPFTMVGKDLAIESLTETILDIKQLEMKDTPREEKAGKVLLLAGPSGHGKTQLANRLGELMQLDVHKVDCTNYSRGEDLFGISGQWAGGENPTSLNAFLVSKAGQPGIVFLDEVEKTNNLVRNALLIPFREGIYRDRVTDEEHDCSDIIWVLATNALDPTIVDFLSNKSNCDILVAKAVDAQTQNRCYKKLSQRLRESMTANFGQPFAGRIRTVIPFLPFSRDEQLIGIHKLLHDQILRARQPVIMPPLPTTDHRLYGNVDLVVQDEYKLCSQLSNDFYSEDTGMPSLKRAVIESVVCPVLREYRRIADEITESDQLLKIEVFLDHESEVMTRILQDDVPASPNPLDNPPSSGVTTTKVKQGLEASQWVPTSFGDHSLDDKNFSFTQGAKP